MPRSTAHRPSRVRAPVFRREESVFINCPFDPDFRPAFDAIVFSTVCCGFSPRCAIESGSVAVPRMERIVEGMVLQAIEVGRTRGLIRVPDG
jgi:hypothetical protein